MHRAQQEDNSARIMRSVRAHQFRMLDHVNIYLASLGTTSIVKKDGSPLAPPRATHVHMRTRAPNTLIPMGTNQLRFDRGEMATAERVACAKSTNAALSAGRGLPQPCGPECKEEIHPLARPPCPRGYHRLETTDETHRVSCLLGEPAAWAGFPEAGAVFSSSPHALGILALRNADRRIVDQTASCAEVCAFSRTSLESHRCVTDALVPKSRAGSMPCQTGVINASMFPSKTLQSTFFNISCMHLWLAVRQRWFYNPVTAHYLSAVDHDALRVSRLRPPPYTFNARCRSIMIK